MRKTKPAPVGKLGTGCVSDLNVANNSPKISSNQAAAYARKLGGDHFGANISCPGPGHGPRDRSLSIRLDPNAPDGFLVNSFAGDDWRACRDYVKDRLGLQTDRAYVPPVRQQAEPDRSNADYALKTWAASRAIHETLAAKHLASRGIALAGDMSHVLRFHPACPFGDGARLPCMVALYRNILTNEPRGIHRTALTPDGQKIDRKMLGVCRGAAIKLSPDCAPRLGIGEGIETCLSVIQAGAGSVWALGSAGGIAGFPALPAVESLSIFADHDPAGLEAAVACAKRWRTAGRAVRIIRPRIAGMDFNDQVHP